MRRALLIGCALETYKGGLEGISNDLDSVTEMLQAFHFGDIRRCEKTAATRAGILNALDDLVRVAQPPDVVVLYYAGHGATATSSGRGYRDGSLLPTYILPNDFVLNDSDNFHGIVEWELSHRLRQLTEVTHNVTIIMDCCHSAEMVRAVDGLPTSALADDHSSNRASSKHRTRRPAVRGVSIRGTDTVKALEKHLTRLRASLPQLDELYTEANPHIVRVMACERHQKAHEGQDENGISHGYLTMTLCEAALSAKVPHGLKWASWHALGQRIKERIRALSGAKQVPKIGGPHDRLLFSLRRVDTHGVLTVAKQRGKYVLRGGAALGVQLGDTFRVVSPNKAIHLAKAEVARLRVTRVAPLLAEVAVTFSRNHRTIQQGALAYPDVVERPRLAVAVQGNDDGRVRRAIEQTSLLRVAPAGEAGAIIDVESNSLGLLDGGGRPWRVDRWPKDADGLALAIEAVTRWAHACNAVTLVGDLPEMPNHILVRWGRIHDHHVEEFSERDAQMNVGERLWVEIINRSSDKAVRVSMLDVGIGGVVSLLTSRDGTGVRIPPDSSYMLGGPARASSSPAPQGLPVDWNEEVPAVGARRENILVFLSSGPVDVRPLQTNSGGRSAGTTRDVSAPIDDADWVAGVRLSFLLVAE